MILSESMLAELEYLLAMILYGALISFCYHMVLYLRTCLYHIRAMVDAQDILFLCGAGFAFFLVAYEKNNGILRWYAFAGFFIGIYLYIASVGKVLELIRKWLLQKLKKPFKMKVVLLKRQKKKKSRKGRVSESEGCSPERESKRKKKKRV